MVGFDLFPPLETLEKAQWRLFLLKVADKYESDPVVHLAPDRIEFKVGDWRAPDPRLFYCKISTLFVKGIGIRMQSDSLHFAGDLDCQSVFR